MSDGRRKVTLVEVGPRDGLQILERILPTDDKLAWIEAERAAGMRHFEVASFVPARLLPQMADATEVVALAKALPGLEISALVPNVKGAEAAIAAGADVLVVPLSASEAHSRANVRRTPEEMVAQVAAIVGLCRVADRPVRVDAGIATAFGCTIQGAVPEEAVLRLAADCVTAGADSLGLADTVGYANPDQVRRLVTKVRAEVGPFLKGAHFHDTRGLALANVVAALDGGIRRFDSSLGGLGGCPHAPGASGNVATEDLAFMLEAMGYDTGVDLPALLAAREILARLLPGEALHGKLAQAGLPKSFPILEQRVA
ncbi:MAG: hydroxymethylglutaryl-CoA lyase [Rhodospirillum sp.]|nr:hydroxymethylglutaryl-CoA lyase [Rhodospirillum sp.]MCF8491501.1 hydroxymethylglutaryl-CoA lyase [Rhodospirillum sp.]MCF8499809.1 hydroxymethylglutaryl-CoA lyase [Rhodospirillum sp.]